MKYGTECACDEPAILSRHCGTQSAPLLNALNLPLTLTHPPLTFNSPSTLKRWLVRLAPDRESRMGSPCQTTATTLLDLVGLLPIPGIHFLASTARIPNFGSS